MKMKKSIIIPLCFFAASCAVGVDPERVDSGTTVERPSLVGQAAVSNNAKFKSQSQNYVMEGSFYIMAGKMNLSGQKYSIEVPR